MVWNVFMVLDEEIRHVIKHDMRAEKQGTRTT